MVRSTLPPFGLASKFLGGVDLAFSELERWVKQINFDRNLMRPPGVEVFQVPLANLRVEIERRIKMMTP